MATDSMNDIQHLNLSFDRNEVENSCLRLVRELSPHWKAAEGQNINTAPFTEGITNILIKVSHKPPGRSDAEADREAVLVRVYGNGTETMIDRAKELRVHNLLADKGLASPVLAKFDNGFMHGFIQGQPCTAQDFHDAETSRAMARRLGQWHGSLAIDALGEPSESGTNEAIPNIWTNAIKWINLLPADTVDLVARNQRFIRELDWLKSLMMDIPGLDNRKLVFSHTDLLCGNVIIENSKERSVTFIDYEYATAAPAAFDIANVFAEWAGPEGELAWMPSKSQRMNFIRTYVESFHANSKPDEHDKTLQEAIDQLYQQVELFRGLPGFYWGIWGLIQASISDIDFDYVAYAERRHSEYWGWKAEHDGSRAQEGREATVRERKWARE